MQTLLDRIKKDAEYVGDGIIKLDSFLNHQVDPQLTHEMAEKFIEEFTAIGVKNVEKIVTAEVSGIPSALMAAHILGVPLLFARKHRSAVMTDVYYMTQVVSRTKGTTSNLMISKKYLGEGDRVLLIDDFLATGATLTGLCNLIVESGAILLGVGCVIEKPQENGREKLADFNVPIVTLAKISWDEGNLILAS